MTRPDTLPRAVHALVEAGRAAPSADNSQPIGFHWNGHSLALVHRGGGGFRADAHATRLTTGAVLENLAQAAEALELAVEFSLNEDPEVPVEVALPSAPDNGLLDHGHPLFSRHTNRLPTQNAPLGDDLRERLQDLSMGECRVLLLTDPQAIDTVAEAIRLASAIRFRVQATHEMLAASLRFAPQEVDRGDGLDVRTLGLPPGGAQLLRWLRPWHRMQRLNRLGLYRLFALMDRQRIQQAPALALVVGGGEVSDSISAGRIMQRFWVAACAAGLAVHPYYAIRDQFERRDGNELPGELLPEVTELEKQVAAIPGLDAGPVHMVFRLGWPIRQPVPAKRLPLSELLVQRDPDGGSPLQPGK